jgi:hypothetical protein
VSSQLLGDDEDSLTWFDQGQRFKREHDVTFANSSTHLVMRVEPVQQVGTNHTCCKASNTHFTMEQKEGSYHWDYLMIMGNISPVLSYHIVSRRALKSHTGNFNLNHPGRVYRRLKT